MHDWIDGEPPLEGALPACFVVGCGNSGTTLVASRLGLHPRVFTIPEESTMFRPHRRLAHARERLLAWMEAARAAGATHLVEKTPRHVQAVGRIRRLLPEARIVAVVRNPFNTALSLKKRLGGTVDHGVARWRVANETVLALLDDPRILPVRYEALTAAPEAELGRILAFLGLPWDARVLESGATPYEGVRPEAGTLRLRAHQVAAPIRANSGKWRNELTPREIERIRSRTARLWAALGGDPQTGEWRLPPLAG